MIRRLAALGIASLLCLAALPSRAAVEVVRVVSPGGIEAWLVENHANPIISVAIAFRGGSTVIDEATRPGTGELLSGLMNEGAGSYDSQAFQQLLEEHSIDFEFKVGRDSFEGSIRSLTKHRDLAFDLLRLSLTELRLDQDAVERVRSQLIAMLAREAEDPDRIASKVFWRMSLADHPYGRPVSGTPETVAAITLEELRHAAALTFSRDQLMIGVVGDITAAELGPLLDRTFAAMPASAERPEIGAARPLFGDVAVIERDVPQSTVVFGQPGVDRQDPDFYAAFVLNYILGGGGFASRLTEEVREKRGLAYGVTTWLNTLEHADIWQGQVATQNARVGESIELIRGEWKRMAELGPTAEELADAKTFLTGSFALRLDSTGSIARFLVGIQIQRLGIDYPQKRNSYIESVTLKDVRRIARRLDPAKLTFVVVGRPEGVMKTREAPEPS
ncbi:MAG TPA: pitrilysin family protein [Alphaproteobacteria bacterium]|nr:pitrilysin family protein [Alphaproteobacteria bacterium]